MSESGDEKTVVEPSLGLKSHTGTTRLGGSRQNRLLVNTNVDLIVLVGNEALVQGVLAALVVDMTPGRINIVEVTSVVLALYSVIVSDGQGIRRAKTQAHLEEVKLVEEVCGVVSVLKVPLLGDGVASTGKQGSADSNERRGHGEKAQQQAFKRKTRVR